MLSLTASARQAMNAHAVEGYPLEICGLLVGTADGDHRSALEAWPVRNGWEDDPELRKQFLAGLQGVQSSATTEDWDAHDTSRRFVISPRDVMLAMKRARSLGWDIIGVYHTHPNHPAIPSEYDRSVAQPDWSYVILSVRDAAVAELRSWALNESEQFDEETVD